MTGRDRVKRTLIAYDIPDGRRRAKVAKILLGFGDRVQYSVFVVDLLPAALIRLRSLLSNAIDGNDDSVLMCDLGFLTTLSDAQFYYLGRTREITEEGPLII